MAGRLGKVAATSTAPPVADFFSNMQMAPSNLTDTSGRPFLTFKDPNKRKSVLDTTRVATTYDPRVAQPLIKEQTTNGRITRAQSDAIRKERGATDSQQLDHTIPLSLGGSNNPRNLNLVENAGGTPTSQGGKQPLV